MGCWRAGAHGCHAGLWRRPKKKREEASAACASCASWAAGERNRPTRPEARQREGEGFSLFPFYFSKFFESFSNEFESPFEIKHNQINSAQNMHQHECSSMYSNFDVDFILINLLFSLCLNAHTSKNKSI